MNDIISASFRIATPIMLAAVAACCASVRAYSTSVSRA